MAEMIEILKALLHAPAMSQGICILIAGVFLVFFKKLKAGLDPLDTALSRIVKELKILERDAGSDPEVARKIEALFQRDSRLNHHWKEYYESVAVERDEERLILRATQPASQYFSFDNLVHAIDWKHFKFEFYAAVPGVLTGLGLLGTFAGLVTGLPEGQGGDVQGIVDNIGPFLNHMRGAFVASMLGVFSALLFNIFERHAREKVQSHCIELCNLIDNCFPRKSNQAILNEIRNYAEKQLAEFKNLALDIGAEVARGIIGNASATLKIDEGLKEGVAKGFGILAGSLTDFVNVQSSFAASMTQMQIAQKEITESFSAIQIAARATSEQVNAASNSISISSGALNEVTEKLSGIVRAVNSTIETQSTVATTLGEASSKVMHSVGQLIGQQTEMQGKFQSTIGEFEVANRNFTELVGKYHAQQNTALANSLTSFDGAMAGAVSKLDSGLGNLNVLMNDFVQKLDDVKSDRDKTKS